MPIKMTGDSIRYDRVRFTAERSAGSALLSLLAAVVPAREASASAPQLDLHPIDDAPRREPLADELETLRQELFRRRLEGEKLGDHEATLLAFLNSIVASRLAPLRRDSPEVESAVVELRRLFGAPSDGSPRAT
ncbi:MAG: hypothetical protein JNL90_12150 [Planctomycetes bacterium]|nr:hypothetical protein [Planctomycetota bacterium]